MFLKPLFVFVVVVVAVVSPARFLLLLLLLLLFLLPPRRRTGRRTTSTERASKRTRPRGPAGGPRRAPGEGEREREKRRKRRLCLSPLLWPRCRSPPLEKFSVLLGLFDLFSGSAFEKGREKGEICYTLYPAMLFSPRFFLLS